MEHFNPPYFDVVVQIERLTLLTLGGQRLPWHIETSIIGMKCLHAYYRMVNQCSPHSQVDFVVPESSPFRKFRTTVSGSDWSVITGCMPACMRPLSIPCPMPCVMTARQPLNGLTLCVCGAPWSAPWPGQAPPVVMRFAHYFVAVGLIDDEALAFPKMSADRLAVVGRYRYVHFSPSRSVGVMAAAISTLPPSIFKALPCTKASAIFLWARTRILPKVGRETFIRTAASS